MDLSNSDGDSVDPVPFLVVALLGFTICLAWGPVYLLEFDIDLPIAVAVSLALASVAVVASFYRLVWTTNPTARQEVPAAVRFKKLFYAILIGVIVVLVLLGIQEL